jgi:hypothetical protein
MMTGGGANCQLKALIEVLAPFTSPPAFVRTVCPLSAVFTQLTECRLLDIYLWVYSGTYEPRWQRRPPNPPTPPSGAGRGTEPPKPHPSAREPIALPPGVELF